MVGTCTGFAPMIAVYDTIGELKANTLRLLPPCGNLEWTEGDRLRHSKFVALREDKNPRDVIKEA